jgi:hypothetical protein
MPRGPDTRFAVIEDAADLLKMLPAAENIVWPTDPGDQQAVDEALQWLSAWLPRVKAARRLQRRMVKERAAAVRTLALANGANGARP